MERSHASLAEPSRGGTPAAGPHTGRCGEGTPADDRGSTGCILVCLPLLRLEPPCSAHPRDARHAHSRICRRADTEAVSSPGGRTDAHLDVRSREPRYAESSRANISGTGAGPADSAKNALKIKPVLVPRPRPGHDQRLEESLDHFAGVPPLHPSLAGRGTPRGQDERRPNARYAIGPTG
jgi:hypothetical protein